MKYIIFLLFFITYLSNAEFNYITVGIGERFTIDTTFNIQNYDKPLKVSGIVNVSNTSILYIQNIQINGVNAHLTRLNNIVSFDAIAETNNYHQVTISLKMLSLAGNDTLGTIKIQNLKIDEQIIDDLLSIVHIKKPYFRDYYIRLAWIEQVYPVPVQSSENINLIFNIDYASNCEIYLYDVSGKNSFSHPLGYCLAGMNHKIISLNDQISAGLYYLFLKTPTGEDFKKIMIVK